MSCLLETQCKWQPPTVDNSFVFLMCMATFINIRDLSMVTKGQWSVFNKCYLNELGITGR